MLYPVELGVPCPKNIARSAAIFTPPTIPRLKNGMADTTRLPITKSLGPEN